MDKELESDFVLYDESLELKKLGFDEPCIAYYDIETRDNTLKPIPMGEEINSFHSNRNALMVAAPTYRQVFRWFRIRHNLLHEISSLVKDSWLITIQDISQTTKHGVYNGKRWNCDDDFDEDQLPKTYEQAEHACLRKMIEIIKNKK